LEKDIISPPALSKRKLNSFRILKFKSARLKRCNYTLDISLQEAIFNNEVISLGENELLYTIRRVLKIPTDFEKVDELEREKKKISAKKNSNTHRELLGHINRELDTITYVPELVAVQFSDTRHYENIATTGLYINGKKFVRMLAGAGAIRRNTVYYIEEELWLPVTKILDNGRNLSLSYNPAKYNAYMGLYGSSGHAVSTPKFAVIPDYHYVRMANLTWITENDAIENVEKEVSPNVFDGQGLISPTLANKWADELRINHTPASFIFRAPFAKGQIVTFDFASLASDFGISTSIDLWGDEFDISGMDMILSESQFKLWDSYDSLASYMENMRKNSLSFRITRYSPEFLRNDTSANYMFEQVLELSDNDIEGLASSTLDYFRFISTDDPLKTVLYLSGVESFPSNFDKTDFRNLDPISQCLLLYPHILHEKYISQRISSSLEKKKKQAKLGKLLFEGQYSPLIVDPYAQTEWLCNLTPIGILKEGECYSHHWNLRNVKKVASARSPLTHTSEMIESSLVHNDDLDYWFYYNDTVFITSMLGLDMLYYADGDADGDLVFSTPQKEFIQCRIPGNPISYEHGSAPKVELSDEEIQIADINGFNSKIGYITNISSTLHCMKYGFPENSPERIEIDRRLVLLRLFQGEEIDGAKNGGVKRDIPLSWTKYSSDLSDIYKKLIVNRRPYFTRYLYDSYNTKYLAEIDSYNKYSYSHFSKPFSEVLDSPTTDEEKELVEKYYKYSFFIFPESPMNRICWYMESGIDDINIIRLKKNKEFDYSSLLSKDKYKVNSARMKRLKHLFIKYNSAKKAIRHVTYDEILKRDFDYIVSQIASEALEKVTSSAEELGNLAVSLMIEQPHSKSFVWNVFGKEISGNLLLRYGGELDILLKDINGTIPFMFNKFSKKRIQI